MENDPLRVLVVEDSEDDLILLERNLRKGGLNVVIECVDTQNKMETALDEKTWDIIISDYSLPEFNGMQALDLVIKKGLDIPFIVLSGALGEETAVKMMKAGAHDYIVKGSVGRLVPAIERELKEAGVRRERRKAEEALLHSLQKMQENIRRLTALRNIDFAITNNAELRQTVQCILDEISGLLSVDVLSLLLPLPDLQTLDIVAVAGLDESVNVNLNPLVMANDTCGKAALERKPVFIPNLCDYPPETSPNNRFNYRFSSYAAIPMMFKNEVKGVLEFFCKSPIHFDQDWKEFSQALSMQLAMALDNADMLFCMEKANLELISAYEATIEGWSAALELRDKETQGHSERVTEFSLLLARKMNFPKDELLHFRRGVLLHDIGKMGVPDYILLKPGPLNDEEWIIMKQHPVYAYKLLSGIPYLRPALDVPYSHHERWDGSGYPLGLKGENIPLAARIFSVVDVWDALTSDRPYRPAWSSDATLKYITEQSGKQFDPDVVKIFLELIKNLDRN